MEGGTDTAERRQLTVVFADLMESTALSERLDPEVLRRVLRAYQEACAAETRRFGGHLAQYLGDGVVIFFGYPVAHEDSARRAVQTALGILARVEALNRTFQPELGRELGVRLGLHTGTVVVEDVKDEGLRTPMATGETPNIAARVQALAPRNGAVLTADTHRLVAPYFQCEDLGPHRLKGLARPVHLYRLVGESNVATRLEAAAQAGFTPLVGRQNELAWLRESWQDAAAGHPRWVLLSGEPGIGKSRLVEALRQQLKSTTHQLLVCQCSPYRQNSAFAPVSDLIGRHLELTGPEAPSVRLRRLETRLAQDGLPVAEALPLLAPLLDLPVPENDPTRELSPARRRQKTLEVLTGWLLRLAQMHSVLWVVEDLHWADPSTLDLLGQILHTHGTHRLLTLLTARPEFQLPWPLGDSGRVWALSRLAEPEVVRLVTEVTRDQRLPTEVVREIVRRTDGVPLFVEELTKMLLESAPAQHQPTAETIPVTLQDSLLARLDRLGSAKPLAQWGALLGREFRQDVLEAVAGLEPGAATPELERLTSSGLLVRTGPGTPASYLFKHALVQDAACHSLLKATRRAWHRRIGETLERRFPELAATQPEHPARHYTEGRDPRAALAWWYRAGEAALARAAHPEAEAHFRTGLGQLRGLSDASDLAALELQYCLALGNLLMATQGYAAPEVGRLFGRARELCQELRAQPQLAPAVSGLWSYSIVRCEFAESTALAAQMMALARETGAGELELEAEAYAGINLFWAEARFAEARGHLERAAALYDVERDRAHALVYGQDPGVVATAHLVWVLWILGETEAAVAQVAVLRRLARARGHAHSCGYALAWENTLWFLSRRAQAALRCSEEALRYCTEQGFPLWHSVAAYVNAWARTVTGQGAGAIEQIQEALGAWRATGAVVSQAYQLSVLAEVQRLRGEPRAALQTLEEALALTRTCGERWYRPELLRLRAELLLARPAAPAGAAESNLREALELARTSGARMWEMRAALSLARLWQRQGRPARAQRLLEPVCAGFPAGFAEPEFLEAQRLLGQTTPAAAAS
jgi:class 3 adenylate cyclase/predicted ATPase